MVHDHLWIDIHQHTKQPNVFEKRTFKYRQGLFAYAIEKGYTQVFHFFDIHNYVHRWTPLCMAFFANQFKSVEYLLAHHADINKKNMGGEASLHIECAFGNRETVKFMLEHGANPNITNNTGRTPLFVAARCNCEDIIQLLLEHGADTQIIDTKGKRAIDYTNDPDTQWLLNV